jgi:tetratricopeptide (TPR) repeat protein
MKRLIACAIGVLVLITVGCSTTQTVPVTQPVERSTNETALAWFERGSAYLQAGDYEDAVKDFTNAIDNDPNFADAYYSRGRALGRIGKHEQAIADFTKTIALNPGNANVFADRGVAYGSLGQHESAIKDFTQAITLNPNFAGAYYNRAIGYFIEKKMC